MTYTGPYMDNKGVCIVSAYGYIKMSILIAARIDVHDPVFSCAHPPSEVLVKKSYFSFTLGPTWTCSLKASRDAVELMGFSGKNKQSSFLRMCKIMLKLCCDMSYYLFFYLHFKTKLDKK